MRVKTHKRALAVIAMALGGVIALGSSTIRVSANVPPQAGAEDAETQGDTGSRTRPLTPDGNGTEVDSTDDNGKYFYTFVTDEGNYFYIVVDESRKDKNVHVLSQVDERELMTLCGGEGEGTIDDPYVLKASSAPSSGGSDLFGTPTGHSRNGYDSDGDGIADSFDMDGDGITDAWDKTKDGGPDSFDTNGDGSPDIDISAPGVQTYDLDGNGFVDAWDTDGDGIADACDTDRDHIPDRFGASAAQFASSPGQGGEKSTIKGFFSLFTFHNILIAVVILAVFGAGFYFKIYRPKHRDNGNSDDLDFEDDPDYREEMSGGYSGDLSCDAPIPEREPERAGQKDPEGDMHTMRLDDTKEPDTSPITFVHRTDPDGNAVSFEKPLSEDEKKNERNEEARQLKEKIFKQKQEDLKDQKAMHDKGIMTGKNDDEWDKVTESAMGMIIRDGEGSTDGLAPSFG